jgi:hypothetical protein
MRMPDWVLESDQVGQYTQTPRWVQKRDWQATEQSIPMSGIDVKRVAKHFLIGMMPKAGAPQQRSVDGFSFASEHWARVAAKSGVELR